MSLDLTTTGITANIVGTVGNTGALVDSSVSAVSSNVSARLAPSTTDLVPRRLSTFNEVAGFRQEANLYVDDGLKGARISLRGIKDLNTKILTATDVESFDHSKVVEGDYIYTEK